jgi:hypothetical protein
MKKLIPFVVVGILVLSGLGAAAFKTNVSLPSTSAISKNISTSVQFSSEPMIEEKDGFVSITIAGATTQLLIQDRPVLPIYVKTSELPYGSTNVQVTCTPHDISVMEISAPVVPARIPLRSQMTEQMAYVTDPSVYGSAALYPDAWYTSDLGAGRNDNGQEVVFVKVVCYPVRYSPLNNELTCAGSFDVSIQYNAPDPQPASVPVFDMVVIAPEKFHATLQPLIDWKNSSGLNTTFKSMESILDEYTGYDAPEQVKYFIKYAYDTWGITYVMLVGGVKSEIITHDKDTRSAGSTGWWVPVRYVSIPQDDDEGCLCDLYYGCLYNATGAFDSWDSNGDHVYAAWGIGPRDNFDLYPEVYVSRLPCSYKSEVATVVKKIMNYEKTGPADKSWWTTFVGVGGKTFKLWQGQPDGEWECDHAYNFTKQAIPDLKLVACYSTHRDTGGLIPVPKDIIKSFNKGASFVCFEGHGNPLAWNTIWFDGTYPVNWTGGLNVYHFPFLSNRDKLPVVVVGGCHNGLYNLSIIPAVKDKAGVQYYCSGYPFPVCFCWGLVVKPRGGAIGSIGGTGYGMGDPDTFSSALDLDFFREVGNGTTHLGAAHGQAIQRYLSGNPVEKLDAYCVTIWALFGDPSLVLGGYSS